jgi:hypothetical protein
MEWVGQTAKQVPHCWHLEKSKAILPLVSDSML